MKSGLLPCFQEAGNLILKNHFTLKHLLEMLLMEGKKLSKISKEESFPTPSQDLPVV